MEEKYIAVCLLLGLVGLLNFFASERRDNILLFGVLLSLEYGQIFYGVTFALNFGRAFTSTVVVSETSGWVMGFLVGLGLTCWRATKIGKRNE